MHTYVYTVLHFIFISIIVLWMNNMCIPYTNYGIYLLPVRPACDWWHMAVPMSKFSHAAPYAWCSKFLHTHAP